MSRTLRAFIEETGDTPAAFARRIGADVEMFRRILSGEATPDPSLARRIVEATSGALSFAALLGAREHEVGDISAHRRTDGEIDAGRLREAIAAVLPHLGELGRLEVSPAVLELAADAAANTYAALARVTTRRGPARLAQALRPILEEILREYSVPSPDWARLHDAAMAASDHYYRS